MRILIIYSYPNHKSLNYSILKTARDNLKLNNDVKVLDLYQDNFDPALKFDQEHPRHLLNDDPSTKKYRDLVTWADEIVFIFPIWWAGVPAILKGFIDRVFVQGFAYQYEGKRMVGLLKNKKAWIITTCDAPAFSRPFLQDYGKSLQWFVLKACGFKNVRRDILYSTKNKPRAREKFIKKIANKSKAIV
ncbi:NAD(P)H-dependent oxidoreductase [Xylocopilactobacillus apis]|uniref:NAD(P)H dehydrogenase (Quinone) n=1 Tax=Xylocopilactobacillus apis TaxID=2932183 RepID=A0AAU9DU74_9LACO|nr:NAD(P)H-dependent oxidoreductase [Xylocopilactobacillus apis]BDR57378.1 NAD(P)H dehydrogenase (quinone) [Xylocopilactobacillus apis]